ncbi:MAG: CusA/CzcA family heavy metal efflux RND transporter [Candidatus Krumholzibacteriales bacterium]
MKSRIIEYVLKRRWAVVIAFAGICVLGTASLLKMPIDAFPDISPNLVQVFAEMEGTAPEEVEQFVTRPVEIAMRGITGVEKIRSTSSPGLSTVNIYFRDDIDIYLARQLVAERLREAEEQIPETVNMHHGLEMGAIASGMGKILSYYLDSDSLSTTELRTIQDWIVKREIQTVSGVAKVISQGGYVRQYQIRVSPGKLLEYDVTINDVIEAVKENNLNTGAGIIERGAEELVVRTVGLAGNLEDIGRIVIDARGSVPVQVMDVADVRYGRAFRRGVGLLNGDEEIVMGGVYKTYGANSFEVIGRLRERIEQINRTLPEGVSIRIYYDQSALVKNSIDTVRRALILGLILVCLVSFLFLGDFRNALIVLFSLPFSMLFSFIFMHRFGIPGDLISFGGVAIALGMIVDATIIMVEKIQSFSSGESMLIRDRIVSAVMEVGKPILFATFIIIIVFLPIFTLGDVEGKMFRPLAFAVSFTMFGALIYALIGAPVLYRLLHGKSSRGGRSRDVHPAVISRYLAVLKYFLERRKKVVVFMAVLIAAGLLTFAGMGKEFMPELGEGSIQVFAYMNPNISLAEITRTTGEIAEDIKSFPEIRNVVADIGYGEVGPHMHHTNYACINVTLNPKKQWKNARTREELVSQISGRIENYPGVSVSFSQPIKHEVDGLIAGAGAAVVARIFGHDLEILREKAAEVNRLLSGIEGVADLRTEQVDGQAQLLIDIDDSRTARHGLAGAPIQNTLRAAIAGVEAGKVFEGEKVFGINVRFDRRYRESPEDAAGILIRAPGGYNVPVRELADIRTVTGLRQISREDTRRYISVQCNVRGRDVGSFVEEARELAENNIDLPGGYRLAWGGQFELKQAADRRLALIIPITLLLVLLMLYGLFNSFRTVLLIMLNIPLALVGGVFALALFGENVSIPSSIGFIALFGIALTDGLVLISRFGYLKDRGLSLRDTVISGCASKFRPVVMTTLTTALGLFPLVIASGTGSEIQRPLAIVVIGGLVSSTLLTLLVLPTIYEWVSERGRDRQ